MGRPKRNPPPKTEKLADLGNPLPIAVSLLLSVLLLGAAYAADDSRSKGLRDDLRAGHYASVEKKARLQLDRAPLDSREDSLHVADLLDILGEALRRGGKAAEPEAESVCLRALRIKKTLLTSNDPALAITLHNLGALQYARGDYRRSLTYLNHALEIREGALGVNDPEVATTLLLIASVRSALGEDTEARSLVERAVAIQEAALSPDHPDLGWGLNSLAVLCFNAGDYVQAEPLQERALSIFEHAYGRNHVMVGTCLHNLAALRYAMGDYKEARSGFERALRIREQALGRDHVVVSYTLSGLAMDLEALRDYEGARARYERALRLQEKVYGPDHDEVGWTLMRIGELQIELQKPAEARALLRRALTNLEHGLGPDHPYVAEATVGLAAATGASGDAREARDLFQHALDIQERVLGPTHPEVGVTLGRFARFLSESKDTTGAIDAALRADAIFREHLRLTCRSLPESRALGYAASRTPGRELALAILARESDQPSERIARIWDSVIRARALVLDEMATRGRLVGDLARYAKSLEETRQRLANLLVRGPGDDSPERYRALVESAREETDRAEKALAGASADFRGDRARGEIGWSEVASSLPRTSVLVAYAVFGEGSDRTYVALVLSGGGREPKAVPIGRAVDVDALVSRWRAEVARGGRSDARHLASEESSCRRAGSEVRRKVWDPVASRFASFERVFLVPDGSLHLINWAALPDTGSGYLVEREPLLHLLSTERDLVRSGAGGPRGRGMLAVGGPSFDEAPFTAKRRTGARQPGVDGPRDEPGSSPRGIDPDCEEFSSVRFGPIPEAAKEAAEVAALWPKHAEALVLTGSKASESEFKLRSPGRRVIHIATHGFFLRGTCIVGEAGTRGIGGLTTRAKPERRLPVDEDNLLLLSGLAFAGANRRKLAQGEADDGILTAQEVSSLDLSGLEWAVLSGCDTGVGDIRAGEGVFGLRRAFQVAGAGTVIMSLWPVEDESARVWMQALYAGRLRRNLKTDDAVREACRSVLRERRAQARSTHPFFWAGFVAAGDWR
jgi:CHAT domain-containing protein/tetratricopeptide (TPR) repeat protein